jgi:hypothetical protein
MTSMTDKRYAVFVYGNGQVDWDSRTLLSDEELATRNTEIAEMGLESEGYWAWEEGE